MRRRGFTLIELLVVIAIIGIVIAIVLPALSGARTAAKVSATTMLINDLKTAVAQYRQDTGRLPGYFGVREMGADENATEGFTSMENILLDLAGGTITSGTAPTTVGPDPSNRIGVDVALIGSPSSFNGQDAYFNPPAKYFTAATGQVTSGPTDGNATLPDLVDAFGTPILLWVRDELATGKIVLDSPGAGEVQFARESSGPLGSGEPALFYWNQNAGFLKGTAVGKEQVNQDERSLLGTADDQLAPNGPAPAPSTQEREQTLAALLGHPSFHGDLTVAVDEIAPTAARGAFVFHTAGPDGVYLKRRDKRAGSFVNRERTVAIYGNCFNTTTGEATDLLTGFDDAVFGAGN